MPVADMDLDKMERKFKANMAEAFDAWVLAAEVKRPLKRMAWEKQKAGSTSSTGSMGLAVTMLRQ